MHGPLFRGAFGTSSFLTEKDLKMFHLKLLEKDLGYKDDFGRMTMLNECELNELVVLLELSEEVKRGDTMTTWVWSKKLNRSIKRYDNDIENGAKALYFKVRSRHEDWVGSLRKR